MRLINSVGVLGSLLCCFYCVTCVFVGCSFVILLFVCLRWCFCVLVGLIVAGWWICFVWVVGFGYLR